MNLDFKHIQNCKMLPNRYRALDFIPKGGVVAEVGVLGGDFSKHILSRTNPERLYLLDTFCSNDWDSTKRFTTKNHEEFIKQDFAKEIEAGQVKLMKGLSWDLLDIFPNHYFDWMYIDADHTYDSVKKDLGVAHKKIKENGLLVMNDYIMYDHVMKENYGVIQAVNEFCVEHNWEIIYFALHPQMFCDVVLRKITV